MSLLTPTLHTARLRLRPFDDADADDLFAPHSNPYVLRYWDAPPWSARVRSTTGIALLHLTVGFLAHITLGSFGYGERNTS
jgi:RimJ/RimL family protein N-acetyltransferase